MGGKLTRRDYAQFVFGIGYIILFIALYFSYGVLTQDTEAANERLGIFTAFTLAMFLLVCVILSEWEGSLAATGLTATVMGEVAFGWLCYTVPREHLLGMCIFSIAILVFAMMAYVLYCV